MHFPCIFVGRFLIFFRSCTNDEKWIGSAAGRYHKIDNNIDSDDSDNMIILIERFANLFYLRFGNLSKMSLQVWDLWSRDSHTLNL